MPPRACTPTPRCACWPPSHTARLTPPPPPPHPSHTPPPAAVKLTDEQKEGAFYLTALEEAAKPVPVPETTAAPAPAPAAAEKPAAEKPAAEATTPKVRCWPLTVLLGLRPVVCALRPPPPPLRRPPTRCTLSPPLSTPQAPAPVEVPKDGASTLSTVAAAAAAVLGSMLLAL